jgi:hypothetical protein
MQPTSSTLIPDGLLAAMTLLSGSPRLGLKSKNPALHPGHNLPNSTAATGDSWSVASETRWSHEMGRFLSPDYSDDPDTVPYADFTNPQSFNLYSYGLNNPLSHTDSSGHDVNVCTDDGNGGQQCTLLSNDQYQAAQQAGNGGLNVPSLNSVGTNGSGSITDANGDTVGSASYVSNGGADYYGSQAGFNLLGTASATVGSAKGVGAFYGASALGAAGAYFGGLTALGGVETNSILGAAGQRSLAQILSQVTDQGLRNVVTNLYRATATIGDGGTADAISYTKETGELVGGSDHIIKGQESIRALERVINSGRLNEAEKGIAQYLQNALKNALK